MDMSFPETRPRRLRRTEALRRMVRETTLSVNNLMYPLFVVPGKGIRREIPSLPGQFHLSVDQLAAEAEAIAKLGIPSVMLFGLPEKKDKVGTEAWHPEGIVQRAIKAIKRAVPGLCVSADCCLCEYTSHGHCGILLTGKGGEVEVDNDATLENLGRTAVSQANAGADIIAPSGMMDGTIGFLRDALDEGDHEKVVLLSYSVKYASAYYGPFRAAADSAPSTGDRKGYQMDGANLRESLRELELDVEEGADMVMVKPALPYLDVIAEARREFDVPIAAYNVSGEYLMLKAAAEKGFLDYDKAMMETLTSIRRAGADLIVTYHAKEAAIALKSAENWG
jgi:porphobilinogen synthase